MSLSAEKRAKEYWLEMNPSLTIGAAFPSYLKLDLAESQLSQVSDSLLHEGYFTLPSLLDQELVLALREAMLTLKARQLPPVYIYLYDQAWFVFAAFRDLLTHFLGEEPALLPNFWAWHLETEKGAAGWPPHQDCQAETCFRLDAETQILMSLSLWIPLNPATEDNGCMVVLPRSKEKGYAPPIKEIGDIHLEDGVLLPAEAGSVMGWAQDVYHWSSQATGQSDIPRISLSLEFQNPAFDPLAEPLLDAKKPLDFEARLSLIDEQFKKYSHMQN